MIILVGWFTLNRLRDEAGALIGVKWELYQVMSDREVVNIPISYGAYLHFSSGGGVDAKDGVNVLSGEFAATKGVLTIRNGISSAAGYAGKNKVVLAAVSNIPSIFMPSGSAVSPNNPVRPVVASYTLSSGRLTIRVDDRTMIFLHQGSK